MSVVRIPFQVIIALGLLTILILELFRPFTGIPDSIFGPVTIDGSPYAVWPPFAAQFAYFTIWTNVLFVFTLVVAWIFRAKINPYWKNAVATYLMVMLIVFFSAIVPFVSWTRSWWLTFTMLWNHLGVVLIGLWWFFTTKTETKTNAGQSMLITLIVPILYLIFVIVVYSLLKVAPYNFLNFENAFGLKLALPWSILLSILAIVIILLLFVGFNWLFVWFTNDFKAMSVKRGKKGARARMEKNVVVVSDSQPTAAQSVNSEFIEIIANDGPSIFEKTPKQRKRKITKKSTQKKTTRKTVVRKTTSKKQVKTVKPKVVSKKSVSAKPKKPVSVKKNVSRKNVVKTSKTPKVAKKQTHKPRKTKRGQWDATYHHHNNKDDGSHQRGETKWRATYHHHHKNKK